MANSLIPESSLLLGIIPALILLYYSIKEWQGKFSEKTLFILFVIGIISGFLVAIIKLQFRVTPNLFEIISFLLIFSLLEQIVKTMILNMKRFQEKQENIIYGLGLGLGFGSIYPPLSILLLSETNFTSNTLLFILIGSIGLVFLHGITGALISYGIYKRKLLTYYLYSVIILLVAYFIGLDNRIQWINLILGIILYWYVHREIIKTIGLIAERRKRVNKTQHNE